MRRGAVPRISKGTPQHGVNRKVKCPSKTPDSPSPQPPTGEMGNLVWHPSVLTTLWALAWRRVNVVARRRVNVVQWSWRTGRFSYSQPKLPLALCWAITAFYVSVVHPTIVWFKDAIHIHKRVFLACFYVEVSPPSLFLIFFFFLFLLRFLFFRGQGRGIAKTF